jgi:hypothetical protein
MMKWLTVLLLLFGLTGFAWADCDPCPNAVAAGHFGSRISTVYIPNICECSTEGDLITMFTDEDANACYQTAACTLTSAGSFNAMSAASSAPCTSGSALPGTCSQGQCFIKTGDGSKWTCTATNTWYQDASKTYTATLDFAAPGAVPGCSADLTITVTNSALGDPVILGVPNGSIADATQFLFAWVSAAGTVKIRSCQLANAAANPASGTFSIKVLH